MMNDIGMIKYQLQQFENLKSSKQLLNKELNDIVSLLEQTNVTSAVPVVEKFELSYPETINVNLGENVSLKNDVSIYSNMYDATNQNNKLNPLYSDSNMKINGVVFNVNGNLVYVNDQHKIDEFQQLGCQITALSLSIDGVNTTGFYNVNDVNINTIEEVRTL